MPCLDTTNQIQIYKGNSQVIPLIFKRNGVAVDLTNSTIYFSVKKNLSDTFFYISKTITSHTDPTNGVSAVSLTTTDTNIEAGEYLYDVRIDFLGGDVQSYGVYSLEILQGVK